jgi:sialidase-1
VRRLIEPGVFAYSSLAAGRSGTPSEGRIYLQYESGPKSMIARFNLAWLLQGEPTGDGAIPDWAR